MEDSAYMQQVQVFITVYLEKFLLSSSSKWSAESGKNYYYLHSISK